jgi:methylmalonyl-CoA mutase
MEYFAYTRELLDAQGAHHIRIFGGGGGVIVAREIAALHAQGIDRIFSPEDGRKMGLQGMINWMLERADFSTVAKAGAPRLEDVLGGQHGAVARAITLAEEGRLAELALPSPAKKAPVLGITGTGGAGKSSLTDELILRYRRDFPSKRVAVLATDPTRRRTGGALLGDRIRLNAIEGQQVFVRSLASRGAQAGLSQVLSQAIGVCQAAGFDLILVETSGIGQGDSAIIEHVDRSVYVMTAEYGAATQLEKIEMLDYADLVALNKFDRRAAEDALRAVRKQWRRNRDVPYSVEDERLPVFGTMASRWGDRGVDALYVAVLDVLGELTGQPQPSHLRPDVGSLPPTSEQRHPIIPPDRERYLSDIGRAVRGHHHKARAQAEVAREAQRLAFAAQKMTEAGLDASAVEGLAAQAKGRLQPECAALVEGWEGLKAQYAGDVYRYEVRGQRFEVELTTTTLSGTRLPKVSLPRFHDDGDALLWQMTENVPGRFPYTAGIFPFRRQGEEPKRQFAGEGTPERTNRRFHYLCKDDDAKRLSTAFDSVTLYGHDPDERPDIYGKVGESGVSVCTLDDMKKLYAGFDLCDPKTSVSMTINGPAPIILAMFLNTAIDQQLASFAAKHGRAPSPDEAAQVRAKTLQVVRGTVQADILKEDQAQNTCIFSTDFSLKLMGDIQEYFIQHKVRNYYSVSISGYHIAEAGANPISQLAFTLANGFTFVEYYLRRGMDIDDFAPNLSFFFSNGLDPEYTVLGRVARRIWAVAMRDRYGAGERSQMLKYHIQTSGRSLHAQEIQFNDIRTTLQALLALWDNCNSLHTNAYDEAITTPTEESVRRAMAIQLIINREFGLTKNENPWQGSFVVEALTDLVEEAVLAEFDRISERGGVLGAMETQYQRSKIQDESIHYELKKHSGELPLIGVNTFLGPEAAKTSSDEIALTRASEDEKQTQLRNLRAFQDQHASLRPQALDRLKRAALAGDNLFEHLMDAVRVASLGQISQALYEVGGRYRRNM